MRVVMRQEVRVRGDSPGFPWDRRWGGCLTSISMGQKVRCRGDTPGFPWGRGRWGTHKGCHGAGDEGQWGLTRVSMVPEQEVPSPTDGCSHQTPMMGSHLPAPLLIGPISPTPPMQQRGGAHSCCPRDQPRARGGGS